MEQIRRCEWAGPDQIYIDYHDNARCGSSAEEEKVRQGPGGERGAAHCRRPTYAGDTGRSAIAGGPRGAAFAP